MSDHPSFKPSRRSAIAPFIVMEMMAAANARAASGAEVLHLEVGEPGGGTPPAAVKAAMAALADGTCGYTEAFGLRTLRRAIATRYEVEHGVDGRPRAHRHDRRCVRRLHPGLPRGLRRRRSRDRDRPGYPGLPQHPACAGHRGGGGPDRPVDPIPADARAARPGARADPRPDRGQPVQSRGHDAVERRARAPRRLLHAARHPHRVGRDLPRHHLRRAGRDGARLLVRRHRRQQLLEILRHDRLAARLAGAAGGAGRARDQAGAEPVHFGTRHRPACGTGCHGRRARAGPARRALPPQPGSSAAVLPEAGLTRMAPADGAFYLYIDISEFAADSVQLCRRCWTRRAWR